MNIFRGVCATCFSRGTLGDRTDALTWRETQ